MRGRTAAEMIVLLLLISQLGVSHSTLSESGMELDFETPKSIGLLLALLKFKTGNSFLPMEHFVHRYQAPVLMKSPDISRDASKYQNIYCPQPQEQEPGGEYNETCLVLSVHVPAGVDLQDRNSPPAALLPVLLFIHGGSFIVGAGTMPVYEGRYLSKATSSIVVTINYRLGPLGFLVFDDGENKIEGNQGLKDQRLAMKWVNLNIRNFGGDTNKITIFGESAGAQSTMFHLVSSLSEPYFQRAIMESNPAIYHFPNRQQALQHTALLLEKLKCSDSSEDDCCLRTVSDYQCLMGSPAKRIINGMEQIMKSLGLKVFEAVEPFRPYIDQDEFTDQPMTLFKDGNWNTHKPFIIGTNREELVKWEAWLKQTSPMSLEAVVTSVAAKMGKEKSNVYRILDAYNTIYNFPSSLEYRIGKFLTHYVFTCPTRTLARFASNTTNSNVYLYEFDHALKCDVATDNSSYYCGNSVHGEELFFVFRTIKHLGMNPNLNDTLVSDALSTYWGNMAWTGDPSGSINSAGIFPEWPPYTKGQMFRRWPDIRINAMKTRVVYNHLDIVCDLIDVLQRGILNR